MQRRSVRSGERPCAPAGPDCKQARPFITPPFSQPGVPEAQQCAGQMIAHPRSLCAERVNNLPSTALCFEEIAPQGPIAWIRKTLQMSSIGGSTEARCKRSPRYFPETTKQAEFGKLADTSSGRFPRPSLGEHTLSCVAETCWTVTRLTRPAKSICCPPTFSMASTLRLPFLLRFSVYRDSFRPGSPLSTMKKMEL